MATDLQTKPAAAKYEAFVDQQLARVRQRIRALDAGRSLLMLGVVSLGYFLFMAAFDLAVDGADTGVMSGVRLALFGLYVLVMAYFLGQLCLRLYRRINPYYAARQLEETIPDAKNSVINWLDLKEEALPGAIRNAVGLKAARDLKQTDPDRAVNPKSNWLLGGILAGLVLGLFILFALGPNQFGSLLGRAFAPFQGLRMESRAVITLLQPAEGNATVSINQRVEFQARIEGRFPAINQPGAPRVLYRYQQSDPFVILPLEEAIDGTWTAGLSADQVQSGFWYRVAAGDAETDEYQVKLQSAPQANRFEVTYHYRPYRKLDKETITFPNENVVIPRILEMRGTEVTLVVRTNRLLRQAQVSIAGAGAAKNEPSTLQAEILPDDPKALRVKFTLERSGTFRVLFTSSEGEANIDQGSYDLEVLDDSAPRVVLTSPGKDVSLPANGILQLEGAAHDDLGLKYLALRMKVLEGEKRPPLAEKFFPESKSLKFEDGTFPEKLDYLDVVALDKLKTEEGKPFPLKAGMVLEYWLEAIDNSDYPNKLGNIGKSEAFKLTIQEPAKDEKKQQDERQKAEEKKKQHDKQQEEKLKQENKDRNEQKKEAKKTAEEKKLEEKAKNDEQKKLKENAEKLKDQLEKQQGDKNKGEAKPDDPAKAENKPGQPPDEKSAKNKDNKLANPDEAGKNKEGGKDGDKTGQAKDQGPKDKEADKQGEAKGPGEQKQPQAGAKGDDSKKDQADKGNAKQPPKEQPGQAKDQGQKSSEKPCNCKEGGPGQGQNSSAKKQDGAGNAPPPQAKDDKGGADNQNAKGDAKGGPPKNQQAQAQEKGGDGKAPPQAGDPKDGKCADPAQCHAKGSDGNAPKGQMKPGDPKNDSKVAGKSSGKQGPDGAGNAKNGKPEQNRDSGVAKDDKGRPNGEAKEPTPRDVANLEKDLKRKEQAKEALDELQRIAKEAKDEKVRDAAKEAVDQFAKEMPPEAKDKGANGPDTQAKADPKDGGEPGMGAVPPDAGKTKSGDPKGGDHQAKGDTEAKNPPQASSKPGDRPGGFGEGGKGITDDIKPQDPLAEFTKRGGELQLDELKKRVTSDMLKEMGWTDGDWKSFLKRAEKYNDWVRNTKKLAKTNPNQVGEKSVLPSFGPGEVVGKTGEFNDPLNTGRAQPPPEFRDALRQFISAPKKK